MASKKDFAQQYVSRIVNAKDKSDETERIINEINKITYAETNEVINNKDKLEILQEIFSTFCPDGRVRLLKEADNQNYLTMIRYVMDELKKK